MGNRDRTYMTLVRRSQLFGFIEKFLNSLFLGINLSSTRSLWSSKRHRRWATPRLFISICVSRILLMIPCLPPSFRLLILTKIWCSLRRPYDIRCFGMQYSLTYYTGLIPLWITWLLSTLSTLISIYTCIYN